MGKLCNLPKVHSGQRRLRVRRPGFPLTLNCGGRQRVPAACPAGVPAWHRGKAPTGVIPDGNED